MSYQLKTFGGLDLLDPNGSSVEPMLAHGKGMALLAYLAVEAREGPMPRSTAASLLWPDRSEERAQNALRVTLSRIRRDADPALLEGKGQPTVRLNPELVEVDLWSFEDALEARDPEKALERYEGHFLEGCRSPDAAPWQHWVDEARERYRDRAYEAALAVGERARSAGDLDAAEAGYRRACQLRPLREEALAGLVEALSEGGEVAAALQLFSRFDERRRQELDLAPSEELEALVEEIRASGGGSAPTERTAADAGGPSVDVGDEEVVASEASRSTDSVPWLASAWPPGGSLLAVAAVVCLLLAVALAEQLLNSGRSESSREWGEGSAHPPRVALLPFEVIGSDDDDPVAAGIHGDLVTRLSSVSGLQVVAERSVERFRGRDLPLPVVADSLGATWLIEGEVQHAGDEISVSVQLIDPATDSYAWARSYRRTITAANDLFDLQSDITREVVHVLSPRLSSDEEARVERRPTGSMDAYRFYVRGRSLLEQLSPPAASRALEYFDQALARDSSYALAWAGRANALIQLQLFEEASPESVLPIAEAAARRALSIDPSLAEGHAAMGRVAMERLEAPSALASLRRAVELRPNDAQAHAWLVELLLRMDRVEEARRHAERAVELNPMSVASQVELAWVRLAAGDYREALRPARRVVELWRGPADARDLLASVFFHLGRADELRVLVAEQGERGGAATFLAMVEARDGDSERARRLLHEVDARGDPTDVILLNAALGDEDRVFEILDEEFGGRGSSQHVNVEIFLRHFYPETLAAVRADPRWAAFLRELNRSWGLKPDGSLPDTDADEIAAPG